MDIPHNSVSSPVRIGDLAQGLLAWRGRLLSAMLVLYLAGAVLIVLWPRQYVATIIVAPAETAAIATSQILTSGSLLGGGLLDPRPGGNFAVYLAVLRSADAAEMLMQHDLARDMQTRRAQKFSAVLRDLLGGSAELSRDDVQRFLEQSVIVTSARQTITWTIDLVYPDRAIALSALQHLHAFAEAQVRTGLRDTVARRMRVLQTQLETETDLFQRQALYDLLAQQQRFSMVLTADETVAARVAASAAVEDSPSRPNRTLLLMLLAPGVAMLIIASAALLIVRRRVRSHV